MVMEQNRSFLQSIEGDSAQTSPDPVVSGPSISRAGFLLIFDRFFGRVYSYVSRRIGDRSTCERVVKAVLVVNLDLLVKGGDERTVARCLKASSDRLIQQETTASPAATGLES